MIVVVTMLKSGVLGYIIAGTFLTKGKNRFSVVQNSLGCSLVLPIVVYLDLHVVSPFLKVAKTQAGIELPEKS